MKTIDVLARGSLFKTAPSGDVYAKGHYSRTLEKWSCLTVSPECSLRELFFKPDTPTFPAEQPIGAKAKISWMAEADEARWVYFSFSTEPNVDFWSGDEVDEHGVLDTEIFFYVADQEAFQDIVNNPHDYRISDYIMVYK